MRSILLFILIFLIFAISEAQENIDKNLDFIKPIGFGSREKRYVIRAKRWKKHTLTWQLQTQNLLDPDVFIVRNTMHRAFNEWSTVSSVDFREIPPDLVTKQPPDIYIAFEKGEHSDGFPFDGQDGVVAHAFYPRDGRLHFDAEEQWSLNSVEGVNLFQTAVHEIGHLLGLEHSMDVRAAMFAAKRPYDPAFTLGDDDVRAIRSLFPINETDANSGSEENSEDPVTTVKPISKEEGIDEENNDPFDASSTTTSSSSPDSFFPFPLPSIEHFQRRNDWFVL
ncbi:Peptidase metallopeptidase domain-containing protein [Caenorhabditis elegans]|uniref:MMP-like protein n=1 Tax=Caenorhabditis elegans TaxID=6239 RepID=G5ECC4_CAEEL|nr:Peptidase metallopeptidase domain-containing protein [Caenorhabditis elegans]AAF78096.1 MMP-like protein [Caenorhabditis elegans]CCD61839.1 Peptidase metallopeptidase domain-containing protein [Caenorhabditis elegans]|eukprot:NP_498599.1 Zinc MetalloProtease [Caenorhabditis elegans]